MRAVQFYRTFNIAWIFSWEYWFHNYLLNTFPMSIVRFYKVNWWNEFRTKLYYKENVEFFCKSKTKKFTLHICIHLKPRKWPLLDLHLQLKETVLPLPQKPSPKDCLKRNEVSWSYSKMTQLWDKFFYKKLWTTRTTMIMTSPQVQ